MATANTDTPREMSVDCSMEGFGRSTTGEREEVIKLLRQAPIDPETKLRTIIIDDARFSTLLGVLEDHDIMGQAKSKAEEELKAARNPSLLDSSTQTRFLTLNLRKVQELSMYLSLFLLRRKPFLINYSSRPVFSTYRRILFTTRTIQMSITTSIHTDLPSTMSPTKAY